MDKKISLKFVLFTFLLSYCAWGICLVCEQFGITLEKNPWLYIPFMIGGWAPTIASYVVLKRNGEVTGLKEWLKNIFTFKSSVYLYFFVIFLYAIYFVPQIIISGLEEMQPIYMFIIMLPVMLIGGGMEEAGWRYILQPELDKKYGFILSSIFVAIIWAIWHLPLFFIQSAGQYGLNFGFFALGILGLTFALGAIRKISKNVFLCVLFHCLMNAGMNTFIVNQTFLGTVITTCLLAIVSIATVFIYNQKVGKNRECDV